MVTLEQVKGKIFTLKRGNVSFQVDLVRVYYGTLMVNCYFGQAVYPKREHLKKVDTMAIEKKANVKLYEAIKSN